VETKAIYVGFTVPPSIDDIEEIAEAVIEGLPTGLHKHTGGKLQVIVEDFPDAFIEQELELETPFDLLGCYQSQSPAQRGNLKTAKKQDTIYLYRRPILDIWAETGEDIMRLINRIIINEIGTHFGFTQEDIEMYEEDMFGATVSDRSAG